MLKPHTVQQVKDVVRIEEVLGDFMDLKRKGPRFLGLCPFHNEKTPSFNVSPNLGIFKCFGCGESGDAIAFLQKHEHFSFTEAVRWLAKRYHIEVEEEERTPEQQVEQSERESLAVVQQWALEWSMAQLWDTEEGQRIGLAYFRERGFRDDVVRTFQLGYVPERGNAFAQAALAHGFSKEMLEKAGWIKLRDNGDAWDFFQGRVTFPIHGLTGQPIGFGARTLRSDKKLPKYFNSPESPLYIKSRSLYGISLAKKAIVEQSFCCLVEGYTDVISLHQAGIANVVASSGTSLTQDQVRLIKRYADTVTILYDGDAAGVKASLRGIDLILAEGLGVKVVLFPDGDDPDSFARKHSSSEISTFLRDNAKDFLVFKADVLVREAGTDPVKKAAAIHELVESISKVGDLVLRALYVQQCAALLGIQEQALVSELNKLLRRNYRKQNAGGADLPEEVLAPEVAPPQPDPVDEGTIPQERDMLRLLLLYGQERVLVPIQFEDGSSETSDKSVAEIIFEQLAEDSIELTEPVMRDLYLDYRHRSNLGETVDGRSYAQHEKPEWRGLAGDLMLEKHALSTNWSNKHGIHVTREADQMLDTVTQCLDILRERLVDNMIIKAQEQLMAELSEEDMLIVFAEIMRLNLVKQAFAKRTGRVIVG